MRLVFALIGVVVLASCRTVTGGGGAPARVVNGEEARQLVAGGARLVDVRTPEEFAGGHAAGAINLPHEQIAARAGEIGDPSQPVVLYCRSGRRSALAAESLAERGFTRIYDLQRVDAWPGPLERGGPASKEPSR